MRPSRRRGGPVPRDRPATIDRPGAAVGVRGGGLWKSILFAALLAPALAASDAPAPARLECVAVAALVLLGLRGGGVGLGGKTRTNRDTLAERDTWKADRGTYHCWRRLPLPPNSISG